MSTSEQLWARAGRLLAIASEAIDAGQVELAALLTNRAGECLDEAEGRGEPREESRINRTKKWSKPRSRAQPVSAKRRAPFRGRVLSGARACGWTRDFGGCASAFLVAFLVDKWKRAVIAAANLLWRDDGHSPGSRTPSERSSSPCGRESKRPARFDPGLVSLAGTERYLTRSADGIQPHPFVLHRGPKLIESFGEVA